MKKHRMLNKTIRQNRRIRAVAIVLAIFSFAIFSVLFLARDWLDTE